MSSFFSLRYFLSPPLPSSSSSTLLSPPPCSSPRLHPFSVSFPLARRRSRNLRSLCVQDPENFASVGDTRPPNGNVPKSRREILLEYVKNVQPDFMQLFMKRAPQKVVDAMRETVTNMIGTLPPQFFAVTITTVAENLAQLMYSVMMTGYMFRNAQYRLELQQSVEQIALPDVKEEVNRMLDVPQWGKLSVDLLGHNVYKIIHQLPSIWDVPDYAPGTQKKVSGEVIRWNKVTGLEKMDAVKYIEHLETEIEELNRQVKRSGNGHNELMEYLKTLEPQNLKELTSSAGEDVIFAMNTFIKRLLAASDPAKMKTAVTETSAPELGNLLYWLMVVGYSIRNIEVRFDMEKVLGAPAKLAELPPGENI
ncbi:hypothetical protein KSP40_PGU019842 [Platanthera guangdongensis]|uniref:Uncharacterized protein n=1 Tax=Platanthera guangdongensis TaxID=2320717 RepID=A0ABR2M1R9_9ASPA